MSRSAPSPCLVLMLQHAHSCPFLGIPGGTHSAVFGDHRGKGGVVAEETSPREAVRGDCRPGAAIL